MKSIENFFQEHNLPRFRINQFNSQYYSQAIRSFDELSNWSKDLRENLKQEVKFSTLEAEKIVKSRDEKTVKVVFEREKNTPALSQGRGLNRIESVLMQHMDGRNTVCVSCMVGCPVGCAFCATGKLGFHGNLNAGEIVDQVMYFERWLNRVSNDLKTPTPALPQGREMTPTPPLPYKGGGKVTNVVFMGMGEPMLNLENVLAAFNIITDPDKLGISVRRTTISTSGYVPQLRKLIDSGFRGRIAISLHAPNQQLREKLMPVAKIHRLEDLFDTLDYFVKLTNKRVTYEYILINGVNDQKEHALELAKLLKHRLHHVNLIPYNPIAGASFAKSSKVNIYKFADILKKENINYTIRVTMGDDVNAACGQLATQTQN